MLIFQNNLTKKFSKNENTQSKSRLECKYALAAEYLSSKFLSYYNLKDPHRKTSNHLTKIFLYFLRYRVQNIELIIGSTKNKEEYLEFKVNLFSNHKKKKDKTTKEQYKIISVSSFFNNNFKFIVI